MPHRKSLLFAVVLVLLIALSSAGFTQAAPDRQSGDRLRTITVTGVGTVTATPDRAGVSLIAQVVDEDVREAMQMCNERMDAILEALLDSGIVDEDNLQTNYFSVYQDVNYRKGSGSSQEEITVYRVANSIRVTIDETDMIGAVIGIGVEAGATSVSGLSFTMSDYNALADEAMLLALADARAEAERIATDMNLTLGEPLQIQEGGGGGGGGGGSGAPPIIERVQTINAVVTVTFEVTPQE